MTSTTIQAVLAALGLMVLLYVGYRVILALRPSISIDDSSPSTLLSEFEEMRFEGDINEEELRSIRAAAGKQLGKSS